MRDRQSLCMSVSCVYACEQRVIVSSVSDSGESDRETEGQSHRERETNRQTESDRESEL